MEEMYMKTGLYKLKPDDLPYLKTLLLASEKEVDAMDEAALEAAELEISMQIRGLLKVEEPKAGATPLFGKKPQKLVPYYAGGMAFLAAALCLFMLRAPLESELAFQTSKGSGLASDLACSLRWIQGDRSSPDQGEYALSILPSQSTHVEVYCSAPVYTHLAVRKNEQWIWLRSNQELSEGRGWISEEGATAVLNLTPEIGSEIMVVASTKPLEVSEVSFTDEEQPRSADEATQLWFETFQLRASEP